jgi:hypothetical protein
MNQFNQLRSDVLNLLLTTTIHTKECDDVRAKAIRKCAKAVHQRTKSKPLKQLCKKLRNEKNDKLVIQVVGNLSNLPAL